MNILRLTLYKKYFIQILNKEKLIEYRETKPFWEKKFSKKSYDVIEFINGYGKHRPFLKIEIKQIIKTDKFFEIHLGEILETRNIEILNSFNLNLFQDIQN